MSKGRKVPASATSPSLPLPVVARMPPSNANANANPCIAVAQQSEREAVITLFAGEHSPAVVRQVGQHASWFASQLVEQLVDTSEIACRAGCAWCCSLFVSASAPEILQIADYLRVNLLDDELVALHERLVEREWLLEGKTAEERSAARLPCVLLVDHRCSVHPVRPLACGSWTSTDARRCEESWQHGWTRPITANQMQQWLYGGVMLGLREALDDCTLDSEQLDLATALRIALDMPDAAERWLAGEAVFADARVALGG